MVISLKRLNYLYKKEKNKRDAIKNAERKKERSEKGLCIICGKPFVDQQGRKTCRKCRRKAKDARQELKRKGLCQTCKNPLSEEDKRKRFVNCERCRAYRQRMARERYLPIKELHRDERDKRAKEKQEKEQEIKAKKIEDKLRKAGFPDHCRCGNPLEYGYLSCAKCREKALKRYYERKQEQAREQ